MREPSVIERINRNKSVMELLCKMLEQALVNLHTYVVNFDLFSQQENDEVQTELSAAASDLVEHDENLTDDTTNFKKSVSLPTYTVLDLIPDNELKVKIRSLNLKQQPLFNILQSWVKQCVKKKSFSYHSIIEHIHIFLTANACCENHF